MLVWGEQWLSQRRLRRAQVEKWVMEKYKTSVVSSFKYRSLQIHKPHISPPPLSLMFVTSILRLMQSISSPTTKANGFCLTAQRLACLRPSGVTDRPTMQHKAHLQNVKSDSWEQSSGTDWSSFLSDRLFKCVKYVRLQQTFLNSKFTFRAN